MANIPVNCFINYGLYEKKDIESLVIPLFTIVWAKKRGLKIYFHCDSHRTIKKGKENFVQLNIYPLLKGVRSYGFSVRPVTE